MPMSFISLVGALRICGGGASEPLSRALFQRYQEEGPSFMPKWVAFLRETGNAEAHVVAATTLGENLESEAFWRRAIESLEPDLAELEALAPKVFHTSK